jgi:hypothetical protein
MKSAEPAPTLVPCCGWIQGAFASLLSLYAPN